MFARNAKTIVDSLISADVEIAGHLRFKGGLRIEGHVRGNVTAESGQPSFLVLGEHGKIDGEVVCTNLVVNGEINGSVFVSELLEIQPKGRIFGHISYKMLEMRGGALVSGQLSHTDSEPILHLAVSEA